jgi:hypothetical protein
VRGFGLLAYQPSDYYLLSADGGSLAGQFGMGQVPESSIGGSAMASSTVCVETYLRLGSASAIGSCARELIPSLR